MIQIQQVGEKFITAYEVYEQKPGAHRRRRAASPRRRSASRVERLASMHAGRCPWRCIRSAGRGGHGPSRSRRRCG
jgi:hypothetical protein